jgi:uncharacterized protein YkwD
MKMLLPFALLLGLCPVLNAQIAETSQLKVILKNASVDSIQKTERLAAILFHDKINAYRVANGKGALGWDDTLWLASRNHNFWMIQNDELAHHEKGNTKSFSGVTPGDRYDFVTKNKGNCSWSGENALYNYSASYGTIAKNAEHIADYSFTQWKNSPGHNANMLNESSKVHGVAFSIENGSLVWATDMFARVSASADYTIAAKPLPIPSVKLTNTTLAVTTAPSPVVPVENAPVASAKTETKSAPVAVATTPEKAKSTKFVSASAKYVRVDLVKTTDELQSALYSSAAVKKNKALSNAAQHHAEYMAANQKVVHEEKKQKRKYYAGSPHQRIVKASRGAKIFHKKKISYIESIAMVQADAAKFDISALSKTILDALDKEKTETTGTTDAVGFGMVIKRVKNEMRIYVVREEKNSQ